MMIKILFAVLFLMVPMSAFSAAVNFGKANVTSIESRDLGHHDIYFSVVVPTQGCGIEDRALLDEELIGGSTMLSVLLTSLISGKEVVVRVDGCLDDRPKIVKVQIFQ